MHNSQDSLVYNVDTIITVNELLKLQEMVHKVQASSEIYNYIVRITSATRNHNDILLGGSPRSSVAMLLCAKANALMSNRDYIIPDDVKTVAPYVLAHRLIPYRTSGRKQVLELIDSVLKKVPIV
jgi:MoxR-like ATPase